MCATKGSRVCGIICITCVIVAFTALGCVLLFGGVAVLVERTELSRVDNYNAVQDAVNVWNTPSSPYSRYQLAQLNATAVLVPGPGISVVTTSCPPRNLTLVPGQCTADTYTDAASDFQPVPQLKLCGRLDYLAWAQCDYQVTFYATQPGSSGVTYNLTAALDVSNNGPSWVEMDMQGMGGSDPCASEGSWRCFGEPYRRCKAQCEDTYGGIFTCNTFSLPHYMCEANAWTSSVAVKVVAFPLNNTYGLDKSYPRLGDGAGAPGGANILAQGLQIIMPTKISGAPLWLYDAGVYFAAPTAVTIMVRSSGDPYLTYMAVTSGTGWLGYEQITVTWVGSILVALGGVVFLGGLFFACCLAWGCGLARDSPDTVPDSCIERQAWAMGMTCCPPATRGKVAPDGTAAAGDAATAVAAGAPPQQQQQMVAYPAPGGGYVWVPAAAAAAAGAAAGAGIAMSAGQPGQPGAYYPPGAYPPGAYYPPPGASPAVGPAGGGAAAAGAAAGGQQPPVAAPVAQQQAPGPTPAATVQSAPPPPPPAAAAPPPGSPAGALPPMAASYGTPGVGSNTGPLGQSYGTPGASALPPVASRPVLPPM
ncbi:hypothetical protein HYH02_002541 [Chlamydomonas schloesseri]|uniref:Uncharacterized protein n=1 Tax=Chlamydomonas schloesseri TaxID=2026947 RepID=A0A836BBC6_9CHLO|nr:hypothetical protein HYH02_002541 [Chlamydomonas schloesseri]|eukprot:KAG2453218.1 hypothetical protein HYH02_002541 [Chlamydomonas schloesseri]